jgi:DNA polymerase-3 subunit alpha
MGFLTVEDYAGSLECVLFADVYENAKGFLDADRVVLVKGRLDRREAEGEPKIVAGQVADFEANRSALAHTLYLNVPLANLDEPDLERLMGILARYPGQGDVVLSLVALTGRRVRMKCQKHKVGIHPDLLTELRDILGQESVRLGEAGNGRTAR